MVNKVILIGRLTADPELRATASGVHVANVRIATNAYAGRDQEGRRKERTEFHRLVLFGRQAEVASDFLRKGRLIFADGRLQTRTWEDAGHKRQSTEVVVERFQILGPRPGETV